MQALETCFMLAILHWLQVCFPHNKTKADTLIQNEMHITIHELELQLSISCGSNQNIVKSIGYSTICARLICRQLSDDHKAERVNFDIAFRKFCTADLTFKVKDKW